MIVPGNSTAALWPPVAIITDTEMERLGYMSEKKTLHSSAGIFDDHILAESFIASQLNINKSSNEYTCSEGIFFNTN